MKDTKRAYRRYKKQTKFIGRVKMYINRGVHWYYVEDSSQSLLNYFNPENRKTIQEMRELALASKAFTFLKTTSCPCSCECCQPNKYKRQQKQHVQREIFDELSKSGS